MSKKRKPKPQGADRRPARQAPPAWECDNCGNPYAEDMTAMYVPGMTTFTFCTPSCRDEYEDDLRRDPDTGRYFT